MSSFNFEKTKRKNFKCEGEWPLTSLIKASFIWFSSRRVEHQYSFKVKPGQFQVANLVMPKAHPWVEEQVVSQMDRTLQSNRSQGKWFVQVGDSRRGPHPTQLECSQFKILFQLKNIMKCTILKGTLFFPLGGFLMRSPSKKEVQENLSQPFVFS